MPSPILQHGKDMKRPNYYPRIKCAASALIIGSILPASAVDDYFFFGDSLTDLGNLNLATSGVAPGPGYPGAAVSNGPTWAGYIVSETRNFAEISVSQTPTTGSLNFAFAGAQTPAGGNPPGLLSQVDTFFPLVQPLLEVDAQDVATVWAGANDLLNATPATAQASAATATTNIATAVNTLTGTHGFEKVLVMNMPDLGATPRTIAAGPAAQAAASQLTAFFNASLNTKLDALNQGAHVTLVDVNALLADAVANPSQYGLTVTNAAANPNAGSGSPSTLTAEQEATYLFYDEIHPTTTVHQQLARYIAAHSMIENHAADLNLGTDAALALDDRFGFETIRLKQGDVRLHAAGYTRETQPGGTRRSTDGIRADIDLGVYDNLLVGAEIFYASGRSGNSDYDAFGFGLDAVINGNKNNIDWELGVGTGISMGDLTRNHGIGSLKSDSSLDILVASLHGAIRNNHIQLAGRKAYWELGLKQRFAYRDSSLESGGGSLDLRYDSETILTTLANLELGIQLNDRIGLEIALNPVLAHSGGEISGRQRSGLGAFATNDLTSYDTHTARLSLSAQLSENSVLSAHVIAGDDDTFGANLGVSIDF